MKRSNLKIVKINKSKKLFNYEKKVLIKELLLDLKIGYFDFEKEKPQKVKFNLEVTLAEDVFDELFKDKRIDKISLRIEKLEIMRDCSSVGIQISKKRSHD